MIATIEKYPYLSIFITVFFMLIVHLGVLDVTIMEARNFITAREMATENNWLLPTMNGEARYQKPPLPTWLSAISALIFGVKSVFAMRLPTALMVAFLGMIVFKLTKKTTNNQQQSMLASFICITSFYVFAIVNEAPWDIYAHTFILIAVCYLFELFNGKNRYKNALLAGVFTGLSIMSKGPVSLYVLLLPFLISFGIAYKFKNIKSKIGELVLFIITSLIIGGWWFLYVRIADSETFIAITNQETSNWSSYNVRPFYYYWSFFVQSGIWAVLALVALFFPLFKNKVSQPKNYRFIWLWSLIAVVLLSVIPEKKSRYLMPVLIPLAINTSFYLQYVISNFSKLKLKEKLPTYIHFGLLTLIAIAVPIVIFVANKNAFPNELVWYVLLSLTCITCAYFMFTNLRKSNIKSLFYGLIAFVVSLFFFGMPLANDFKNPNYFSLSSFLESSQSANLKVYSFNNLTPEILWDAGSFVQEINLKNKLQPKESAFYLIVESKKDEIEVKRLLKAYRFSEVKKLNYNFGNKQRERLLRTLFLVEN